MYGKIQATNNLSSVYNELRWEGSFTDAIIRVENEEFPVHKVVLSNLSPYFRAMFTRWNPTEQDVFSIKGLSSKNMGLILDYAYTGFLRLTDSNVQELLEAADFLNILKVIQICSDFLEHHLCSQNCISVWQLTNVILLPKLRHKAFCYILEHFEKVVLEEEFLQLSAMELSDIIGSDSLIVIEERTVYVAVMQWVKHLPEKRQEHFPALLAKVRLALLDLRKNKNAGMVNSLVLMRDHLRIMSEATSILPRVQMCRIPSNTNTYARPRLPNTVLLAIGGWIGDNPTNVIEAYDTRANMWSSVSNNQEPACAYHGSAFLGGFVYRIGGFDRMEYFNSMRRYDPIKHTWEEVSPMYFRRCNVSVTVLDGCIYAMGGYDGHTQLSSAEYYKPVLNQWNLIAPMNERRSDASCTTFQELIYICGGYNGQQCLQTAECYNAQTNQWTMITPMQSPRSGVGVVAYAGRVFAVGGFDGNSRLQSVEKYNPQTEIWEKVTSMETQRSNFGIEVIEDHIIVVGGLNGFTDILNAECYNIVTDTWSTISNMMVSRRALSCCVIHGLPNMLDYTVPRDGLQWQPKVGEKEDD